MSLSTSETDDRFCLSFQCWGKKNEGKKYHGPLCFFCLNSILFEIKYSRTSVSRKLMARLPWHFELVLESLEKKSHSCRFGII